MRPSDKITHWTLRAWLWTMKDWTKRNSASNFNQPTPGCHRAMLYKNDTGPKNKKYTQRSRLTPVLWMGVIMAGAGHENWPSVAANIRVRLETVTLWGAVTRTVTRVSHSPLAKYSSRFVNIHDILRLWEKREGVVSCVGRNIWKVFNLIFRLGSVAEL